MVFESSSLAPIREMVKLFSKVHLRRLQCGLQAIISCIYRDGAAFFNGLSLDIITCVSSLHLCREMVQRISSLIIAYHLCIYMI